MIAKVPERLQIIDTTRLTQNMDGTICNTVSIAKEPVLEVCDLLISSFERFPAYYNAEIFAREIRAPSVESMRDVVRDITPALAHLEWSKRIARAASVLTDR